MSENANQDAPWVPCPDECGDFVCNIHGGHVADCPCPAIDSWAAVDRDPYSPGPLEAPPDLEPAVAPVACDYCIGTLPDGAGKECCGMVFHLGTCLKKHRSTDCELTEVAADGRMKWKPKREPRR